jgi:hypothetical protein
MPKKRKRKRKRGEARAVGFSMSMQISREEIHDLREILQTYLLGATYLLSASDPNSDDENIERRIRLAERILKQIRKADNMTRKTRNYV